MVSAEEVLDAAEAEKAIKRMEETYLVSEAPEYTGDSPDGQQGLRNCYIQVYVQ